MGHSERWPPLPLNEWQPTYRTLHMWAQIVGKIRMTLSPPMNHWWHVSLYVNSRGLTTGPIPYAPGVFEIQFDFQRHALHISTTEGPGASRPLRDESVASFHSGIFEALAWLGIAVRINPMPQEVPDPVPFNRDYTDCSYDPQYANRLLLETSRAGVFAAGDVRSARSSASPRPSAKAPWRFRSCMSTSSTCEEVNAPPGARRAAVWSAT